MTLREKLREEILHRYDNVEYWDKEIVEEHIEEESPTLLYFEKEFISKMMISADAMSGLNIKTMTVNPEGMTFNDADELADILRAGVELVDELGDVYRYDCGILNQYRVENSNADIPIDEHWYNCNGAVKFNVVGKK